MIVYPFSFIKSVGTALDPDAAAFLTAIGNTDPTIESAINTLVIDLKSDGLWSKLNVIYPFVGGTATSNKYNLKDPRDLDAAFRLTFNGGITQTNGFNPNGTNGYAQTYYIPANNTTLNNEHISIYSNTNNPPSTGDNVDIGTIGNTLEYTSLLALRGTSGIISRFNYEPITASDTTRAGFFVVEKSSANSPKIYKNGTLQLNGTSGGNGLSSYGVLIGNTTLFGSSPYSAGYSNQNYCFVSMGSGLTATDNTNLYSAVQACQTTLSRQV
jgi:hypothetical protein